MTNYEKIKAMSVEEMAEQIRKITKGCGNCPAREYCVLDLKTCEKTVQEWLESEVEEDG